MNNTQRKKIQEGEKKIYEFVGKITGKIRDKLYSSGEYIYKLEVKKQTGDQMEVLRVYERVVDKSVWEKLVGRDCINKEYLFVCDKMSTVTRLLDLKELAS